MQQGGAVFEQGSGAFLQDDAIERFGGAVGADGDLAAPLALAAAAGLTEVRLTRGVYVCASNVTFAGRIRFEGAARLDPAAGVTATIDGYDAGGPVQRFGGSGTIALAKAQRISPQHWGAVNDNGADDGDAWAACLAARRAGCTIDGLGWTFRIDAETTLTGVGCRVENMTLDFSNVPDGAGADDLLTCAGSQGTGVALSGDAAAGADTVPIADTSSFSVGQWVWLESAADWDLGQSVTLGQMARVKAITTNTSLTLWERLEYGFTTGDSATVAPLDLARGWDFRRVHIVGADGAGDQLALTFAYCDAPKVESCTIRLADFCGLRFDRCAHPTAVDSEFGEARDASTAYGVQVSNGCWGYEIRGCRFYELRHGVTISDTGGISLHGLIQGCRGTGLHAAAIDAHSAADHCLITENNFRLAADSATTGDGIFWEGGNVQIVDNTVIGAKRHGIAIHPAIDMGAPLKLTANDNHILDTGHGGGSARGLYLRNVTANVLIASFVANGNTIDGAAPIALEIDAATGSIEKPTLIGNAVPYGPTTQGLLFTTDSGFTISEPVVVANDIETGANQGIYFLAAGAGEISDVLVEGNLIKGGVNSIRLTNVAGATIGRNRYTGFSSGRLLVATSTGVDADRSMVPTVTVTDAAYTVDEDDLALIVNRAGTVTLTLPDPAMWPAREIDLKTIQAQTVVSASSNVVPLAGGAAGTAILPATDGAFGKLKSNGSSWDIMAAA